MPEPISSITIRACTPADLSGVGKLAARLVREHHAADPSRFMVFPDIEEGYANFLRGQLRKRRSVLLVAEEAGEIVGYVWARIEPRDWDALRDECGALHDVYVDERVRRKGLATRMIEMAVARLAELGADRVILMTAAGNDAAQRLFRRLGFRTTMLEMMLERPQSRIPQSGSNRSHSGTEHLIRE